MGKSLAEIEQAFRKQYLQQGEADNTSKDMADKARENIKDNVRENIEDNARENIKKFTEIQDTKAEMDEEIEYRQTSIFANLLFYFTLVGVIISILLFAGGMLGNRTIGGIRLVNMTTPSMAGVYPTESLLIVREVPTDELRIGDDITFLKSSVESMTHRIVEVHEDEEARGGRTFITKGVHDSEAEEEVAAAHVLGKVSNSIPQLGPPVEWARANLQYIVLGFIVSAISAFAIKLLTR